MSVDSPLLSSAVFAKDTLVNGRAARVQCLDVSGQTFTIDRGLVTTVRLDDEWFTEVRDPIAAIDALQRRRGLDLFKFCHRLPNVERMFA